MNLHYESEELGEFMDQLQAFGSNKDILWSQNDPSDYLVRVRVGDQTGGFNEESSHHMMAYST
jgi:hypothetical protein